MQTSSRYQIPRSVMSSILAAWIWKPVKARPCFVEEAVVSFTVASNLPRKQGTVKAIVPIRNGHKKNEYLYLLSFHWQPTQCQSHWIEVCTVCERARLTHCRCRKLNIMPHVTTLLKSLHFLDAFKHRLHGSNSINYFSLLLIPFYWIWYPCVWLVQPYMHHIGRKSASVWWG